MLVPKVPLPKSVTRLALIPVLPAMVEQTAGLVVVNGNATVVVRDELLLALYESVAPVGAATLAVLVNVPSVLAVPVTVMVR